MLFNDDKAPALHVLWNTANTDNFVASVLEQTGIWGSNLNELPGFAGAVAAALQLIQQEGVAAAVASAATPQNAAQQ